MTYAFEVQVLVTSSWLMAHPNMTEEKHYEEVDRPNENR